MCSRWRCTALGCRSYWFETDRLLCPCSTSASLIRTASGWLQTVQVLLIILFSKKCGGSQERRRRETPREPLSVSHSHHSRLSTNGHQSSPFAISPRM